MSTMIQDLRVSHSETLLKQLARERSHLICSCGNALNVLEQRWNESEREGELPICNWCKATIDAMQGDTA